MTCREKLMLERPDLVDEQYSGGCCGCPSMRGYLSDPDVCGTRVMNDDDCRRCWDREIPDDEPKEEKKLVYAHIPPFTEKFEKPAVAICNELKAAGVDSSEKLHKAMDFLRDTPEIKDSGNRREFDTGAVRDMQEGKGRCDLMPLEVVHKVFSKGLNHDEILFDLAEFMKHAKDTDWLIIALRKFAEKNYDDSYPTMFLEVAKHFEEGAKKYGENNWQKGIPPKCYIDSAVRHYLKWLRGDKDEPHDRAFVWNLMCCIWEVDYREKEDE